MENSPRRSREQALERVARFDPRALRKALGEVEWFNAKLALLITRSVGTMACAYLFAAIALISLPDALKAGTPQIISWIAQTFLQLVLLSIIMVGQSVQAATSDVRAEKQFEDTEAILDRLDCDTAGGIAVVLAAIRSLSQSPGAGASPPADLAS